MNRPSIVLDPCATGLAGTALRTECVPSVRVTTRLGTELVNVPIQWDVMAGGGSIAPKSTVCGSYGSSASTLTNALGRAGICWTLGAPGSNKVRATPSAGGDAPEGVEFVPASSEFEVLAAPGVAVALEIVQGDDQTGVAGAATTVPPVVRLVDQFGYGVPGETVHWVRLLDHYGEAVPTPGTVVTDANGLATTNWVLDLGANRLRAAVYHPSHIWVILNATGVAP